MKKITLFLLAGLSFCALAQKSQPLPEHPRPDLERSQWLNLNGYWDFTFDSTLTVPSRFAKKILVPFPWGSALSEVKDEADVAWYHKEIKIPATWTGKRIFLMAPIHHHFEQKGWKEPQIVIRFWIISFVLALVGLATLKLR